jgi:hypothetical protein
VADRSTVIPMRSSHVRSALTYTWLRASGAAQHLNGARSRARHGRGDLTQIRYWIKTQPNSIHGQILKWTPNMIGYQRSLFGCPGCHNARSGTIQRRASQRDWRDFTPSESSLISSAKRIEQFTVSHPHHKDRTRLCCVRFALI